MTKMPLVAQNASRGTILAEDLENGSSLWAKFMGLMGRASLPPGKGLWLPDENGIHMMFMRFPIDAVFVGPPAGPEGMRCILSLSRALPPWRGVVWHVAGGKGVLELPAGTIDATGTTVGDQVRIFSRVVTSVTVRPSGGPD